MSRPKPTVLLETVDIKTKKAEQVIYAEAIYAVFYKGKPINLKMFSTVTDYPGPKYRKTSFPSPAHAFNLADRLNKRFNTSDFTVIMLVDGPQVTELGDGSYAINTPDGDQVKLTLSASPEETSEE